MNEEKRIDIIRIEQYNMREIPIKPDVFGNYVYKKPIIPEGFDVNVLFSAEV